MRLPAAASSVRAGVPIRRSVTGNVSLTRMSGLRQPNNTASAGVSADDEYRTYAAYFHTLRNAHNRVVLGIDVLMNKPMDDAERAERLAKLLEAARQVTELLDQAPIPRAR